MDSILSASEAREGAVSYARSGIIFRIRLPGATPGPQKPDSRGVKSGSVKVRMSKQAAHIFPFCRSLGDSILSASEAREGAVSYARSGITFRIWPHRAQKA